MASGDLSSTLRGTHRVSSAEPESSQPALLSFGEIALEVASSPKPVPHQASGIDAGVFAAYDELPVMIQAVDRHGRLRFVNAHWLAVLGYRRTEVVGRAFSAFFTRESRERAVAHLVRQFVQQELGGKTACALVKRSGEVAHVLLSVALQREHGAAGPMALVVLTDATELEQTRTCLAETEQRLAEFLAAASGQLWEMDEHFRFTFLSERPDRATVDHTAWALGKTPWESVGVRLEEDELWRRHAADLRTRRPFRDFEYALAAPDGQLRHRRVSGRPIFDRQGNFLGYRGIARDVSEQKRLAQQLEASKERLDLALEGAGAGLFDVEFEADRITYNDRAALMLDYAPGELSTRPADLLGQIHQDDRAAVLAAYEAHLRGETELYSTEHRLRTKHGHYLWVGAMGRVVERDGTGRPRRLVGIRIDVSERKNAQLAIEHLALHDPLTDLPNRAYFSREAKRVCASAGRRGAKVALLLLDLDHFKTINDGFGHAVGDALLTEAARRLEGCVRKGDLVARLGGDEFAILACAPSNREHCGHLAERIIATIHQPFVIDDLLIRAGISIGVTLFPDDGTELELLLGNADMALYTAKAAGRRTWQAFDKWTPGTRRRPSAPLVRRRG